MMEKSVDFTGLLVVFISLLSYAKIVENTV
jgi:hypothetical protein